MTKQDIKLYTVFIVTVILSLIMLTHLFHLADIKHKKTQEHIVCLQAKTCTFFSDPHFTEISGKQSKYLY